jgi:flagellar motility protein MotE (MotC chaperone)
MRLRLLPILMFALVGTTTVKLGAVWNAVEFSVGSESLAQTEPAAPAAAPPADPAADPAANADAAPAATPETPAAEAPAAEIPPADAAPAEAPAEGAPAEATAAAEEPTVPDPFDYTDEEVDVLQQLAKRREEIEKRARQLDEREALIQAAEQRMDQKMAELKALQAMVEDLLKKQSDEQEAELKSLVKLYENMKPKDAAQVFEEMDMDVLLDVVERMNERKAAPILALVTPTRAKEITYELASRKVLPLPE